MEGRTNGRAVSLLDPKVLGLALKNRLLLKYLGSPLGVNQSFQLSSWKNPIRRAIPLVVNQSFQLFSWENSIQLEPLSNHAVKLIQLLLNPWVQSILVRRLYFRHRTSVPRRLLTNPPSRPSEKTQSTQLPANT